jgi:hypothetical protein
VQLRIEQFLEYDGSIGSWSRDYRATTVVRFVDDQGRPLRQLELCDQYARLIATREQRRETTVLTTRLRVGVIALRNTAQ